MQKAVLAALLELAGAADVPVSYYPVRDRAQPGRPTASTRAVLSRALVRLKERGLLRREFWFIDSHTGRRVEANWCVQLSLTAAGLDLAKRLTTCDDW